MSNELIVATCLKATERYNADIQSAERKLIKRMASMANKVAEVVWLVENQLDGLTDNYHLRCVESQADLVLNEYRSLTFTASVEDLRKLREQFGKLRVDHDDKIVHNAAKNEVACRVIFEERQPMLFNCRFVVQLPDDANCKIVEVTETIVESKIVCTK